jgi:hypothetical protein
MLWEAVDSYTPPFYRGKALPTSESSIRVVALTHDAIRNNQYIYTWRKNSRVDQEQSGFGAQSYIAKNTFFESEYFIDVDVAGRQTPFQAQANLVVPRFDPEVRFSLRSIAGERVPARNNAFRVADGAYTLRAEPYFFSTPFNANAIETQWFVQDDPVNDTNARSNTLLFAPPSESGFANIRAEINHRDRILQVAEGGTRITY